MGQEGSLPACVLDGQGLQPGTCTEPRAAARKETWAWTAEGMLGQGQAESLYSAYLGSPGLSWEHVSSGQGRRRSEGEWEAQRNVMVN